ncbi:DUF2639 domain-containing protein [Bacillus nitroreducens]
MAYPGSKGWYVKALKEKGIYHHPVERKKLETYKTYVLRQLYFDLVVEKEENK